MRVKTTSRPSVGPVLEWKVDVPSMNTRTVRRFRHSSLSISIDADSADSQQLQADGDEHQQRLAILGDHMGRLAHDIRNPLSSIEWFATLLGRAHHSQEEREELANHCIQAVRSLDQLVSNILVASAPLHVDRESVCLHSLCDDVELLAMYPIQKKGLIVHRRAQGTSATISGQQSLLKQMLLNLLLNAVHASDPDGSIVIQSSNETHMIGESGDRNPQHGIALRIQDFGCGMTEAELSQIYQPFYSNRKGGTGLGLSIVKHIVHLHHGVIDITSQQGKGTTVELFFPQ